MTVVLTLSGVTLVGVRDGLWRVLGRSGAVLGHIERLTDSDGERFSARRLVRASLMVEVGRFWRLNDAVDCFR